MLSDKPADANVVVDIRQTPTGVTIFANGSLTLNPNPPNPINKAYCGADSTIQFGAIQTSLNAICVGNTQQEGFIYTVTGTSTPFGPGATRILADSASGDFFGLIGLPSTGPGQISPEIGIYYIPTGSDPTINAHSTFNGKTLSQLGIFGEGTLGTYTLTGSSSNNQITVIATPAPLAVLGLPLTYGWTRRLRRRVRDASGSR